MEDIARNPPDDLQATILEQYCSEAGELIASAKSREDALGIRDKLCAKFQEECRSSLVIAAARTFMDQTIEHSWNDENSHYQNYDS